MDQNFEPSGLAQIGGAILGAITAITVIYRKLLKGWGSDTRDMTRVHAETDIIVLLRQELSRVISQNQIIAEQLENVRTLVHDLQRENMTFHVTVERLNSEIAKLKGQQ